MAEFYEITADDLVGIETLLDTGYTHEWFNIFVVKNGSAFCQFNDPFDLTTNKRIRITSDLAFKIWRMVEQTNVQKMAQKEEAAKKKLKEN